MYMPLFKKNTSCLRHVFMFLFPSISLVFPWEISLLLMLPLFGTSSPLTRVIPCSYDPHLMQNPHSSHHSDWFIHLFLWSFTLRMFSSGTTLSELSQDSQREVLETYTKNNNR